METHGFALVTAGKIDPSDLPLTDQLAKPGFANPEILRRLVRPQQRNRRSGFPTHGEAGGLGVASASRLPEPLKGGGSGIQASGLTTHPS